MALEDLTGASKFIDDLVNTNPVGSTDTKSTLDDHIRGVKNVLLNSLPNITGAITATQAELNKLASLTTTAAQLEYLNSLTANVQTQLDARALKDNPVLTGNVSGDAFLDEDDMSSDSAVKLASQQSIKAYVDSRGKVRQIQYNTDGAFSRKTATIPSDNSIPQISEGSELMSVIITPGSTSNILRIDWTVHAWLSASVAWMCLALFNTDYHATNAICSSFRFSDYGTSQGVTCVSGSWYMLAPVAVATTFSLRGGSDIAGNFDFNGYNGSGLGGGSFASSLSVTEMKP